jgi:hypothetical protein
MPALSLVPTENRTELKQTTTTKTYLEKMISFEKERCCCCCLLKMMQMWRSIVACNPNSGRKRSTQILWQGRNTDKETKETLEEEGRDQDVQNFGSKKVVESFFASNFFAYTVPRIRNRNYGLVGSICGVYYLVSCTWYK